MLCGAVAVVVAYLVLAMPGMDHGEPTPYGDTDLGELSADRFDTAIGDPRAVVINVHVPDEGTIAGTDAAIAYDDIVGDTQLPADRDTPLLLYCRSGQMSRIAGTSLIAAGYRNVAHLDSGMDAWTRSGRSIQPNEPDTIEPS